MSEAQPNNALDHVTNIMKETNLTIQNQQVNDVVRTTTQTNHNVCNILQSYIDRAIYNHDDHTQEQHVRFHHRNNFLMAVGQYKAWGCTFPIDNKPLGPTNKTI